MQRGRTEVILSEITTILKGEIMCLIFCLAYILTDFRPLFNRQNFSLFCTFIVGFITASRSATVTDIYQAVRPKTGLPLTGEVPLPWQVGRRYGC